MSEQSPGGEAVVVEPVVPVEDDALVAMREKLRKHEQPSHVGWRTLFFLGSLAAFVYFMRESGPVVIAVVVGVLAFHEAGHFVAMKALGYENMNVFFVPFLGAAVSGRARKPGGWRAGVVSLAGPVPGLVLAAVLTPLLPSLGSVPVVRVAVSTLVFVNALNLLPFLPLDGGRVMNTILFSRHRYLELAGTVIGVIGLFAVPGLLPGQPGIWAGVFVGMLIQRSKIIEATARLREGAYDFEGPTSSLRGEVLWALNGEAHQVLKNTVATDRTHTSTMASIHEAVATRPALWRHAIALFVVWSAALGLGWMTWDTLKHPKARWVETMSADQAWRITFPTPPTHSVQPTPAPGVASLQQDLANSPLGEFDLFSVILEDTAVKLDDDPPDADQRMHAMVTETAQKAGFVVVSQDALTHRGRPALDVVYRVPPNGVLIETLYIAEHNVVHILTTSSTSAADRATFRESFRILR